MFVKCVEATADEDIVKRSPRGKAARKTLLKILELDHSDMSDLAVSLLSSSYGCIAEGLHHILPSVAQCAVWKAFHRMRNSQDIQTTWTDYIATKHLGSSEIHLTLQLLLDRLLKAMLKNQANSKCESANASTDQQPVTPREKNAIRYMAGYVVVSLLKTFKKPVKKATMKEKHDIFIQILSHMKAKEQPSGVDSLSDYTRLWSELIDRGGLYHIGDEVRPRYSFVYINLRPFFLIQVFHLIEAIEIVVRRYLNVSAVHTMPAGTNYQEKKSCQKHLAQSQYWSCGM